MTDTELLHRVAEAMKELAAEYAYKHWFDGNPSVTTADAIRAIDTAALVKEVCGQ